LHGITDARTGGLFKISRFDTGAASRQNIGANWPKSMDWALEALKTLMFLSKCRYFRCA
jgi:hypothetical protein